MQLNIENLTKMAEWLENGAQHETIRFDMSRGVDVIVQKVSESYDPEKHNVCATSCCIAGAAVQFFDHPKELVAGAFADGEVTFRDYIYDTEDRNPTGERYSVSWQRVKDEATELLFGKSFSSLDRAERDDLAEDLFTPQAKYGGDLYRYSDPAWAARVVRRLIRTGKVNWPAEYRGDPSEAPFDTGWLPDEVEA